MSEIWNLSVALNCDLIGVAKGREERQKNNAYLGGIKYDAYILGLRPRKPHTSNSFYLATCIFTNHSNYENTNVSKCLSYFAHWISK